MSSKESILVFTDDQWQSLDMFPFDIGINRGLMDITCLNGMISDSAFAIELPMTARNNKILGFPARLGVCGNELVTNGLDACYQCGGITYLDGNMLMNQASSRWDNKCQQINVSIYGGRDKWYKDIEDCPICEIDAGSHVYNDANIQASWDRANQDTLGVAYYPVHYGGDENFILEELRPHVYFDAILKGIFAKTDYTLCENEFLTSDPWRGLTWIYTGFKFGITEDLIESNTTNLLTGLQPGGLANPMFEAASNDPSNNASGGIWTAPFSGEYIFTAEIRYDAGANINVGFFNLLKNGSVFDLNNISGTAAGTINYSATLCLSAGDTFQWLGSADIPFIELGGEWDIVPTVNPCQGQLIQNAGLLPCDVSAHDFIEAIRIMFGLIFITDEQNKEVCLEPINSLFSSPLETESWDSKVDLCELTRHEFLFSQISRCHKFLFTKDDKDGFVKGWESRNGIAEGEMYADERCLNESYQGEKEHKPLFSPTFQFTKFDIGTFMSMPQLWQEYSIDGTPPELSYDFGNHFAYFAGLTNRANEVGRQLLWNIGGANSNDVPYAYQRSTGFQDEYNLGFDDIGTNYPGLVSTYYSFILDALSSGRIVKAKGVLGKKDWLSLDFGKAKVISNNVFILLDISGWNPKDGQAELTLLYLC